MKPIKSITLSLALSAGLAFSTVFAHENHASSNSSNELQTLTGEIVDLMCYLDHEGTGEKHKDCAQMCVKSGGPVGILVKDKVYLVVGEHKPINDRLASLAGQTATLKGKVVERAGMRMIENTEILTK